MKEKVNFFYCRERGKGPLILARGFLLEVLVVAAEKKTKLFPLFLLEAFGAAPVPFMSLDFFVSS